MGSPAETAFLAAAAERLEACLGGLSWLGGRALGLGLPSAGLLALAGLWLLLDGARRPRLLGAIGGAATGALAALAARGWLATHLSLESGGALAAAGAAGGAVLGGLLPLAFTIGAGALPGGVLGAAVDVGGSHLAGLALGAAALGALSAMAGELTRALAAGGLGALACGAAGLAALGALGQRPLGEELAGRPWLLLGWVLVVGAAGAARRLGGAADAGAPAPRVTPARREGP